jgi:hypothetical protein
VDVSRHGPDVVRPLLAGALWLGVGLAKMTALVWLIDERWQPALLALLLAWSLAAFALWLRGWART